MGAREHLPPHVNRSPHILLLLILLVPSSGAGAGPSLDKIVGGVVRAAYPTLHSCFRKALAADRERTGTVFIQATMGREDRVTGAKAVRDELDHLPTASCLVALVVQWTFPGAAAAGAGPGSEVVIPLTLRADPDQYEVRLADVDPLKESAAVMRPILSKKSVGAEKAAVTHLTLDGRWQALAPKDKDVAVVILDGSAGPKLKPGAALWLPAGNKAALKGKCTALMISTKAAGKSGRKTRIVKAGRTRSLDNGKLKVTPLLGLPGSHTGGAYVGLIQSAKGFRIKPHHHDASDELIFVLEGGGKVTLQDRQEPLGPGSAVNLPARVGHSLEVIKPLKVVQIYVPGGPEARFFKDKAKGRRGARSKRGGRK